VCSLTADGFDRLAVAAADGSPPSVLATPFTHLSQVVAGPDSSVLVVAGTPTAESAPYRITLGAGDASRIERLRPARDLGLGVDPTAWFSVPEAIDVPTTDGAVTRALLHRPRNPHVRGPNGEAPPLLVLGHGGPTSAARAQLNLTIQFWTSRGFCVADVNYRGSTGYGRPYRDALRGRWGIADVDDCVAVARFLAAGGDVDPHRLAIRGGSAGGFTTLAALTFHDTFTAGASHYGIADLEVLARDTHKFEARYLDGLVGPWPAAAATYQERSPIHHTDGLSCPVAIFQGLEDAVVPPEQAELMVAALQRKGVPYAYVTFEGEQHGFRQAPNIIRALEGELWFYGRVFGFDPADPIEPLPGAGL
ncbi:MAG TPA: prolyl oligopeptidase family serine peptidase, partial [Acidimicrobiales bacterium]